MELTFNDPTILPLEPPDETEKQLIARHDAKNASRKVGGGRISRQEIRDRAAYAMSLDLPSFLYCKNDHNEWAVIGGGPSINNCVPEIRRLQRRGIPVVTVNKSHDWALEHGIVPWGHVLLDPKEWVADYVKNPRRDVRYFLASQCHREVFKRFENTPAFLWHAGQDFPEDNVTEPDVWLKQNCRHKTWSSLPGKTTVGLRTPILGHHMGMGTNLFHMFGMDSSRDASGKLHAYPKAEAKDGVTGTKRVTYNGQVYHFATHEHMHRQFDDFNDMIAELPTAHAKGTIRRSFGMRFYGTGLLPFYAAILKLHANPEFNADPTKVGGWYKVTKGVSQTDEEKAFADLLQTLKAMNAEPAPTLTTIQIAGLTSSQTAT